MDESKLFLIASVALLCAASLCVGSVGGATAATTVMAATTANAATTSAKAATTVKAGTTVDAATTAASAGITTAKGAETTAVKNATNVTAAVTTAESSTSAPTTTTQFIPFPESQCFFPFWHNHSWQHTCIKYNDFGDFWCSLTQNFTKDENWRRCRSPDLKRFQCRIPFEYRGKNHTRCLPIESTSASDTGAHHGFWCAVVPKISSWSAGSTDWAYCEHENATGVAYLKAVGVHKELPAAVAAATGGKNDTGTMAVAPVKSLSGASGSGGSGAAAGLGTQATVGIAVGVVCAVLAVVAVVAGVAIRRRRRRGDHKALLQTNEKGTYGGMEASD